MLRDAFAAYACPEMFLKDSGFSGNRVPCTRDFVMIKNTSRILVETCVVSFLEFLLTKPWTDTKYVQSVLCKGNKVREEEEHAYEYRCS